MYGKTVSVSIEPVSVGFLVIFKFDQGDKRIIKEWINYCSHGQETWDGTHLIQDETGRNDIMWEVELYGTDEDLEWLNDGWDVEIEMPMYEALGWQGYSLADDWRQAIARFG